MKSFFFLTLFCAFCLGITVQLQLNKKTSAEVRIPRFLKTYSDDIKTGFQKPENANLLFAFLMGTDKGISPYTKKNFRANGLGFLLSPSGVHLGGFFFILNLFLKKIKKKSIKRILNVLILTSVFFLSQQEAVKRLSLLRFGVLMNRLFKKPVAFEWIFLGTFFTAFIIGHYYSSPLGFLFSFYYIGTFIYLGDQSRLVLIAGLFSNQLVIALFMGTKVSLFSVITGLIGVSLFSILFPLLIIYFLTYWLFPFNWVEPFINLYSLMLKFSAKFLTGSFTSSSIFLFLFLWTLLLCKDRRLKVVFAGIFLCMHTNTAMTPVLFVGNH